MQRAVCVFSGSRYHDSTRRIAETAERYGCTQPPFIYDDHWLKTKRPEFVKQYQALFDHKCPKSGVNRGCGYFIWKMLILKETLQRLDAGSVAMYLDADTWPVADITPLFEMADKESITLFAACNHSQRAWSKRDCQILMGADHHWFLDRQAAVARFMLFKKGGVIKYAPEEAPHGVGKSITIDEFIDEWLRYSADRRCTTFDPSVLGSEHDGFVEHRCEQAALGNLAYKYNISLHREADQWGNGFEKDFPNDTYPQIFESTGVYSYDPSGKRNGSSFRNV